MCNDWYGTKQLSVPIPVQLDMSLPGHTLQHAQARIQRWGEVVIHLYHQQHQERAYLTGSQSPQGGCQLFLHKANNNYIYLLNYQLALQPCSGAASQLLQQAVYSALWRCKVHMERIHAATCNA